MGDAQAARWIQELRQIENKLRDLQARWPAHSLKPAMLQELEALEEERDHLQELLDSSSGISRDDISQ